MLVLYQIFSDISCALGCLDNQVKDIRVLSGRGSVSFGSSLSLLHPIKLHILPAVKVTVNTHSFHDSLRRPISHHTVCSVRNLTPVKRVD